MARIEAICAVGGDTNIEYQKWTTNDKEGMWSVISNEDGNLAQAICERPISCPVSIFCTGKVIAGKEVNVNLKKLLIHKIYFDSRWVAEQLESEQDVGYSYL